MSQEAVIWDRKADYERMLYDLRTKTCVCPKCGSSSICIWKRPIENLYECNHCGFSSRGTITVVNPSEIENMYFKEDYNEDNETVK